MIWGFKNMKYTYWNMIKYDKICRVTQLSMCCLSLLFLFLHFLWGSFCCLSWSRRKLIQIASGGNAEIWNAIFKKVACKLAMKQHSSRRCPVLLSASHHFRNETKNPQENTRIILTYIKLYQCILDGYGYS